MPPRPPDMLACVWGPEKFGTWYVPNVPNVPIVPILCLCACFKEQGSELVPNVPIAGVVPNVPIHPPCSKNNHKNTELVQLVRLVRTRSRTFPAQAKIQDPRVQLWLQEAFPPWLRPHAPATYNLRKKGPSDQTACNPATFERVLSKDPPPPRAPASLQSCNLPLVPGRPTKTCNTSLALSLSLAVPRCLSLSLSLAVSRCLSLCLSLSLAVSRCL